MSHLTESVQGESPDVSGNITVTLDASPALGHFITNSNGETGSGTGFYGAGDYYLFFTGADSYVGNATVSGDTITLPRGTFFIECCPTFGQNNSSLGNTELRAQFVDEHNNGLGNIGAINRDCNATYNGGGICTAYVTGPSTVKLKITSVSASTHFPKNGTETNKSPFSLEIILL